VTTFLTMQTLIADQIVRDDMATQIKQCINQAIKTWEGIRFTFNERQYLINTVAGTEYYSFATPTMMLKTGAAIAAGETILEIDTIKVTVNNSFYPLTERTEAWFDRYASLPTIYRGPPDSYAIFNDQLRLYPVPDQVYAINFEGLARLGPAPLTADGDTNAWMIEGEELARQQAKLILYRDYLRDADGRSAAGEGTQEAQWQLERKGSGKRTGTQRAWNL
jgi:hypothetical protein